MTQLRKGLTNAIDRADAAKKAKRRRLRDRIELTAEQRKARQSKGAA